MSNNLPYINIYKGDFLRSNVSACSIAAQGLWLRLMILMHDSERTGYLCLNHSAMPSRMVAIKCAVSLDEYEILLAELMSVSAFSTSRENILFCPEIIAEAEAMNELSLLAESTLEQIDIYNITWYSLRKLILKRDKYNCRYCRKSANSVDHIIPRIQGGSNYPSNLVSSCVPCNSSKCGRTPEQAGMEVLPII